MLYLFVVAGIFAALCIFVMSGALFVLSPVVLDLTCVIFAVSAGVSTLAIAASDG